MEKSSVGTVMNLSWTGDGTQVAAACGGGYVVFASVVGRYVCTVCRYPIIVGYAE